MTDDAELRPESKPKPEPELACEEAPDEPTTEAPARSDGIRYRGADGEWHELREVAPKRTGDPDLDALWAMSFRELQAILEDRSHPLHEKAQQVADELAQPIRDAVWVAVSDTFRISDKIRTNTASWPSKLMRDVPRIEAATDVVEQVVATTRDGSVRRIDFAAVEPPENASLAEIETAAEDLAHEMRLKQVEILSELLLTTRVSAESSDEALQVSKEALEATKSSKRAGWFAAYAAIAAALIGLIGIAIALGLG